MGFKVRKQLDVTAHTTLSLEWLEAHAPIVHNSLAGPNAASLEALEHKVGTLPPSFRTFYKNHDGQRGEDVDFVPYYYLANSLEILKTWVDQQTYDSFEWKKGWVPFARFDSDFLCLNLEADAQNHGEVFTFYLKFPDRAVIADDFGAFLTKQQECFASGVFVETEFGAEYVPQLELSWDANWSLDRLLQTGQIDAALETLSRLVDRAPDVKKHLRGDARFAHLRNVERFEKLTAE